MHGATMKIKNHLRVIQNFRKRGPLTPLPHTPSRCTQGRPYFYLAPCYSGEIRNKFVTLPISVNSEEPDTSVLLQSTFEALLQNDYKQRLLVLQCLSVRMEKSDLHKTDFFLVGFRGWDLYKTFPQIPILVKNWQKKQTPFIKT
jgi:hypothetical protein